MDADAREVAEAVAAGHGLDAEWEPRPAGIAFDYYTPLSPPWIYGRDTRVRDPIRAEDSAVLLYGMIEAVVQARGKRVVLDPQGLSDIGAMHLADVKADELAICANRDETLRFSGARSVRSGARRLLRATRASVIVSKLGALGAIVTTSGRQVFVGPHPTKSVFPIGTGDAFAAGFAWAWAVEGQDAVQSARLGSQFAAVWSSTRVLPIPKSRSTSTRLSAPLRERRPTVYLAGPYFSLQQRWLVDLAREAIEALGGRCVSPFHDVGPGGDEVALKDLKALQSCDAVLALVDDYDSGTIFEVGWARKVGLHVVAFASTEVSAERCQGERGKMLRGSGVEMHDDLSTAVYRTIWRGMGAGP